MATPKQIAEAMRNSFTPLGDGRATTNIDVDISDLPLEARIGIVQGALYSIILTHVPADVMQKAFDEAYGAGEITNKLMIATAIHMGLLGGDDEN